MFSQVRRLAGRQVHAALAHQAGAHEGERQRHTHRMPHARLRLQAPLTG